MRNATILVVRLRGTATEVIKNIVLAGIGKLVIIDDEVVSEEDLGAGFFFRDEDVGQKVRKLQLATCGNFMVIFRQRVIAAKARVENLNPLVAVEAISDLSLLDEQSIEASISSVNLVCVTDWHRDGLVGFSYLCFNTYCAHYPVLKILINQVCRKKNVPFYCGGTYGLLGYIFCDLLNHEYISP